MKLKKVDIPCLVKSQMIIVSKSVANELKSRNDVDILFEEELGEIYEEVLITSHEENDDLNNKIDVNINGLKNIKVMKYESNCDYYFIPCLNKETNNKNVRIMRIKKIIMRIPDIQYDIGEIYFTSIEKIKKECDRINIKYQVPRGDQDKNHKQICLELMNYYNRLIYDRIKLIEDIYEKEKKNSDNDDLKDLEELEDWHDMMQISDMSYRDENDDEVEIYRNFLDEI